MACRGGVRTAPRGVAQQAAECLLRRVDSLRFLLVAQPGGFTRLASKTLEPVVGRCRDRESTRSDHEEHGCGRDEDQEP